MPKYIVLEKSFINNVLYEAGAEVEFDPGVDENGKQNPVADNLQLAGGSAPPTNDLA